MNKVMICGIKTENLKVLSNKEKERLIIRIKNGDKKAREEFINGNLKLVLSIVQKFLNRGENPDDLFQVGCIGLIKALDNFDLSHGVLFSTYAVPMIIGELKRYLRDNNSVRVSRSMRDTAYKALTAKEELQKRFSREPTINEIAKELNLKKSEVVIALDSIVDPVSLQEPVYSDGGDIIYMMDQIKDEENFEDNWLSEISIKDTINNLTEREKAILSMRFFEGKTQMEVASEIGISQAQVSRIEKNTIDRIKSM